MSMQETARPQLLAATLLTSSAAVSSYQLQCKFSIGFGCVGGGQGGGKGARTRE